VVLGGGGAGLWASGAVEAAAVFGVVFVVHHAGTVPRLQWLLLQ
jgi:hypothetical protein